VALTGCGADIKIRLLVWKALIGNRLPVKSGAAAGASHKQLFGMLCSMS